MSSFVEAIYRRLVPSSSGVRARGAVGPDKVKYRPTPGDVADLHHLERSALLPTELRRDLVGLCAIPKLKQQWSAGA